MLEKLRQCLVLCVEFLGFVNSFVERAFLVFTGTLHHGRDFLAPLRDRLGELSHRGEVFMSVAIKSRFSDQYFEKA